MILFGTRWLMTSNEAMLKISLTRYITWALMAVTPHINQRVIFMTGSSILIPEIFLRTIHSRQKKTHLKSFTWFLRIYYQIQIGLYQTHSSLFRRNLNNNMTILHWIIRLYLVHPFHLKIQQEKKNSLLNILAIKQKTINLLSLLINLLLP